MKRNSSLPLFLALLSVRVDAASLRRLNAVDADASNGRISLILDWTLAQDIGVETRSLGGSAPGPTILASAGTTLRVNFTNSLRAQPSARLGQADTFTDPDTANLHFHGLFTSPNHPGDDPTVVIPPQTSHIYSIEITPEHMPGLHWAHTHHHGSTALQIGGGAACAMIVKDPPGYLPLEIERAEELLLLFQEWNLEKSRLIAAAAGDSRLQNSLLRISNDTFVTVNGQRRPSLQMQVGRWYRFRILFAGWQAQLLDFSFDTQNQTDCEMQLLAKDGIYINDYPRSISQLPIPPGGRAEVMVRCHRPGNTAVLALDQETLAIEVTGERNAAAQSPLHPWSPPIRPNYVRDLRSTQPTEGCSCETKMSGHDEPSAINGVAYDQNGPPLHKSYLGSVNQRSLVNIRSHRPHGSHGKAHGHSYHQHVHPFQIVDGVSDPYYQVGDWHDTILMPFDSAKVANDPVTIRYQTTKFTGNMIVHCHDAKHADQGMLAREWIQSNGSCSCFDDHEGVTEKEEKDDVPEKSDRKGDRRSSFSRILSVSIATTTIGSAVLVYVSHRRKNEQQFSTIATDDGIL